jgi:hypothetical protein
LPGPLKHCGFIYILIVKESSLVDVDSDVEEVQLALHQLRNRLDEAQKKADYYQEQQKTYHVRKY